MCKREMTLGEEIIGLSTRGIDTPTVERMYRKYIEMAADKESKEAMREYCINDELAIEEFINAIFGVPAKSDLKDAEVGDKTTIKLDGLGEFVATVHKVTDDKVMLIFDDYVAERPMNKSGTNKGGFEDSDLNKWLHTEFVKALPYSIRARLTTMSVSADGSVMLPRKNFLRLISLLWPTMAVRTTTALRTLMGFVRKSGWLSKNLRPLWAG